jgi:rifampicin phosphotransferase
VSSVCGPSPFSGARPRRASAWARGSASSADRATLIRPLRELGPEAAERFGGKAAGLARLIACGARVPAGFAVEATLVPPGRWDEAARQELHAFALPLLAQGPVAVRSSARAEDSRERSFAGLFETVLHVRDPSRLEQAVAQCIASGAADRVMSYARSDIPLAVGVVVQTQVVPSAAGVCFTKDPAGRDFATVVEAVRGSGEGLVSGHEQPDRWRVYRSGLGGFEALRDPSRAVEVISATAATRIATEAQSLAQTLGHPLDLEWAMEERGLFWLQARPITATREPEPPVVDRFHPDVDDGPVSVWSNWNVRETMPDALLPLSWSLWREAILPTVHEDASGVPRTAPGQSAFIPIDLVNGRPYWNMNAMLAMPRGEALLRSLLGLMDREAAATVNHLLDRKVLRPRRRPPLHWSSVLRALTGALRFAKNLVAALWPDRVFRRFEELARSVRARPPLAELADLELAAEMKLIENRADIRIAHANAGLLAAMLAHGVAVRAFSGHAAAQRVLPAGARSPTTRISEELETLVIAARPLAGVLEPVAPFADVRRQLRETPGGPAWLALLDEFLSRNGQRGPREFDLGSTRWAEDPGMILEMVRVGLGSPTGPPMADRFRRVAEDRNAVIEAAVAASPWWKRPIMRWLAAAVLRLMPLREAPKHYVMHVFLRMRLAALEAGARLATRSILEDGPSVFLLEWSEVRDLLAGVTLADLRPRIEARRVRAARLQKSPAPPWVRSDGVPVGVADRSSAAEEDGVLRGTGVAGGQATGQVCRLTSPDPRALPDGAILVCEFADPAWTPLFPRAAAVVMEVGGLMCHAAVVAREIGVPSVFGVTGAMTRLREGQTVRVDGETGSVTVVEESR